MSKLIQSIAVLVAVVTFSFLLSNFDNIVPLTIQAADSLFSRDSILWSLTASFLVVMAGTAIGSFGFCIACVIASAARSWQDKSDEVMARKVAMPNEPTTLSGLKLM